MRINEYPDREAAVMEIADALVSDLNEALDANEAASLAVPGGTTPGPVFDLLRGVELDWPRVTVLPTDERRVPPDHPRSNARLIRSRLLAERACAARFLPLWDEATGLAGLAAIGEAVEALRPLSVVMLGMGEDGHVASLFPGAAALAGALAEDAPAVMAIEAPAAPEPRVTLTAPVLRGAMALHLVIFGARKREVIDEAARERDPLRLPVAAVLDRAQVHWAP